MLGRTANDLFWMSRYIERAENIARLLEVGYRIALLPHEGAGQDDEWRSTLRSAGCETGYLAKYGAYDTRDVVNFMLFDPDNASSVYSSLSTARRNARAQRTALTREMWECLNSAWIDVLGHQCGRARLQRAAAPVRLDQGALGAVPRRAAQHHPAQRHLLLQPAGHVPGARRQHRTHPRREILRAAAAQRAGRRRDRQRPVGRHPALGIGAPQLPLGLPRELQALAHRRLSHPQPPDAALAALLLRRDRGGAGRSSAASTAPATAASRSRRRRCGCCRKAT